jgi:hypothetical protein
MKRAYAIDVLVCPWCRGKMSIMGIITDERTARKILGHLGLPTHARSQRRKAG